MINIILASLSVGVGTYLLRKGDLINFFLFLIKRVDMSHSTLYFTISGIFLNLAGIYFWQISSKSNLSYSLSISLYLSLTIITGLIVSSIIEKIPLGTNFFVGVVLVIAGILVLSSKNY